MAFITSGFHLLPGNILSMHFAQYCLLTEN